MKITILTAALLGALQAASPDYVIDLVNRETTAQRADSLPFSELALPPPPRPWNELNRPPTAPFAITGLSLDRTSYSLGDRFTYEVVLKYLGAETIWFPTSPERASFRKSHASLRITSLVIGVEDEFFGQRRTDFQMLYGSHEVSGTLVLLHKDQTMKVSVPAKWVLHAPIPIATGPWSRTLTPFCELNVHFQAQSYLPARSSGNPSLTLSRAK
jgi:hypothetical protein